MTSDLLRHTPQLSSEAAECIHISIYCYNSQWYAPFNLSLPVLYRLNSLTS